MKKIKTREDWMNEQLQAEFDAIHEDEIVDIDIKLVDKPEEVVKSIEKIEGVTKEKVLPFGVIKAKAAKKKIAEIKGLEGVEGVEIHKKK
jgi:hypothetical protein